MYTTFPLLQVVDMPYKTCLLCVCLVFHWSYKLIATSLALCKLHSCHLPKDYFWLSNILYVHKQIHTIIKYTNHNGSSPILSSDLLLMSNSTFSCLPESDDFSLTFHKMITAYVSIVGCRSIRLKMEDFGSCLLPFLCESFKLLRFVYSYFWESNLGVPCFSRFDGWSSCKQHKP